ncbi:hypothetical protein HanRHA438_Chr09g0430181 [Helianthus annuus]|nr:hypothetical protein HanIR_Chr09g0450531 [Helianthus annuus]KAJ0891020.1 hypothetical protein HanRHA438_Chr09g0430181 [Helianthus annuus]
MNTPCVRSFMFVNVRLCSITFVYVRSFMSSYVRLSFSKYINSYVYINIRFSNYLYKYN